MCLRLSTYSIIVFLFTKAQQVIIHSLRFVLGNLQPMPLPVTSQLST